MLSSVTFRRSHVFAVALAAAALAVPAFASAAKAPATITDLAGAPGYCQSAGAAAGPAVGKVSLAAPSAASEGFHPVSVAVKVRAGRLAAGTYDVWLVNIYRDDTGQIIGCSATPFSQQMTVKSAGPTDFRGSVDRYTGRYELQVYVGPIWGPGYSSAPASVDVP